MKTGLVKRLLHGTFKKENKRNRISKKEDSWTNQLYCFWFRDSHISLQASAIAYKYKKSQKTQKRKF